VQCQPAHADLAKEAGLTLRNDHGLTLERAMAGADFASRCIASDDPRLRWIGLERANSLAEGLGAARRGG
jgi:hypothetical protein